MPYSLATFSDLPGWADDDHAAAFAAFLKSAGLVRAALDADQPAVKATPAGFREVAGSAEALARSRLSSVAAKDFFEANFAPHRVTQPLPSGLLTGYYEPEVEGSRTKSGQFQYPIYRRPPDLENVVPESERGAMARLLTHVRRTATGTEPYATREAIEQGVLANQGLELVYLACPVDVFFMQVQGSGRIRLPDGEKIRISYHGKNGHPYTSIGRYLIEQGLFGPDDMTLDVLKVWLRADPERGQRAMWQNKSFAFFRELSGTEAESAMGSLEIPLTPWRSLAVDTAFHALGLPVYVTSPSLHHACGPGGFHLLMIAQDVGSAIKGPERGDIYFGSGDEAGRLAGITKHQGNFFVLRPKHSQIGAGL